MSILVTPEELAGLGEITILDVRWRLGGGPSDHKSYVEGHIPGAVFCALDADLAAAPGAGGRHPLPEAADFQAAMRRLGVDGSRPVVVYDEADSTAAARAWWTLRYFGHPDVRVLDGGIRAWRHAGYSVVTEEPAVETGDFTAVAGGMPMLDADQAADLAKSGVLLDARAAERYRGEVEPIDPVAGHVPGAVSAPTSENVEPGGRFHNREFLRERFNTLGVVDGVPVGVYCGSGVTAAHEVLALELAGIPAALYVGSWSHWVADPDRPVATG
ncbi:sulfurtransferase [Microtetraspora sp. NBRC 16547]|uniref:sulfurtransferase n=1 Tax=Microtetraspora sp. NBRC 16547 TaxID=3030993 RepID=UPI0024A45F26|nr:sulfurtransferase [Microtetraspora sp. NBRC 16547]GLX00811.1 sulfurtransferase [Microtetraspora sp. NBRC 16547]